MIYTVILNSNNRVAGSTVSNATYYFDWTVFSESKYKMTSVFTSTAVNATNVLTLAMLEVQLGQSKVFKANATQTRATTTNTIGFVIPNATAVSTFYYGDITTLPPVYLYHRPNQNDFYVRLTTNAIIPIDWVDYVGAQMTEYNLILTFESIDN